MEKDLNNLTKEELILKIKQLQKEKKLKHKYGLVWDREKEPEQVVELCKNNIPILKNIKSKDIKTDNSQNNILIEGDNYHALQVLNYTHKNEIDVIYIDPPYNTGNKDFKYNDTFVDKEDGYRHSKWLNFMSKRLELARNLLKENGVIFISIDDNEQANLKLLCDEIFGENNFIGSIARLSKKGGNKGDFLKPKKDFILVFAKKISNLDKLKFGRFNVLEEPEWEEEIFNGKKRLFLKGDIPFRAGLDVRTNQRYYIECPDKSLIIPPGNVFPDKKQDAEKVKPLTSEDKCWTWSRDRYLLEKKNNTFLFKKSNKSPFLNEKGEKAQWTIYKKRFREDFLKDNEEYTRKEILSDYLEEYPNSMGTKELKELDINFKYPKPKELVKYLIEIVESNISITILDFFAGSGTTAHAVLDLNKQDGGNRNFILCTNNENNICTEVCYPRIQKVINGYKKNGNGEFIEGLGSNLKYFKTDFIESSKNITQSKINVSKNCAEMLCIKTGIFNEIENNQSYKIFDNNTHDEYLCVFYDFYNDNMKKFISSIKKLKGTKHIFLFSLDLNIEQDLFENIPNAFIEPIPQKILDIYKKLSK